MIELVTWIKNNLDKKQIKQLILILLNYCFEEG